MEDEREEKTFKASRVFIKIKLTAALLVDDDWLACVSVVIVPSFSDNCERSLSFCLDKSSNLNEKRMEKAHRANACSTSVVDQIFPEPSRECHFRESPERCDHARRLPWKETSSIARRSSRSAQNFTCPWVSTVRKLKQALVNDRPVWARSFFTRVRSRSVTLFNSVNCFRKETRSRQRS